MIETYKFKCSPVKQHYPKGKKESESGWYVFSIITRTELPECRRFNKVYSDIFNNDDNNNWLAFISGNMPQLEKGVEYDIEAELTKNKKTGYWGYTVKTVTPILPDDIPGQQEFLKVIVTERQADNILNIYPEFVKDVIDGNPISHEDINGIGDVILQRIITKVRATYSLSDLYRLLRPFNISEKKIQKLLEGTKDPVQLERKIRQDPYSLTEIKGIGFWTIDDIVLKLFPKTRYSRGRVEAFIKDLLSSIAFNEGNTLVSDKVLLEGIKIGDKYKYKGLMQAMPECREIFDKLMEEQKDDN